jgi:hypothetical protein
MRYKDRVDAMMDVEFENDGKKETVSVWVPFETFMTAVRKYFDVRLVTVDGTDSAIWNSLVDCEAIEGLLDNDEILGICADVYKGTKYEEADYSDWLEDLEWASKED